MYEHGGAGQVIIRTFLYKDQFVKKNPGSIALPWWYGVSGAASFGNSAVRVSLGGACCIARMLHCAVFPVPELWSYPPQLRIYVVSLTFEVPILKL